MAADSPTTIAGASTQRDDPRGPSTGAVLLFGGAVAVVATALPLATYTVALAAFGLAHVLAELRYVDQRFGPRVAHVVRAQMLALLAIVVAGRGAMLVGKLAPTVWQPVELGLVALLALTAWPRLWAARPWAAALAIVTALALAAGAVWAPLPTLLVLAVAHNATPVGFLAERLAGAERRRMLALSGALLLLAVVVATGLPTAWLAEHGWWWPELSLLPSAGRLSQHLGQYVPVAWHGHGVGVAMFSAAVYLQCLHYGAVLHVLPRLGAGGARSEGGALVVAWPRQRVFLAVVVIASFLLFGGFVVSFSDARALYGLAAAVHAWIEIPLLLLALAPPLRSHAAA